MQLYHELYGEFAAAIGVVLLFFPAAAKNIWEMILLLLLLYDDGLIKKTDK